MKRMVPKRFNHQHSPFEFTSEGLNRELFRLTDMFIPEFRLPKIDMVVGKRVYTKAALTYYNQNRIVMFKPYHDRFPMDYKLTLLHEVGHIIADHGHGENFKKYYALLLNRQKSISEKIIPEDYSDFLYCKVSNHYTRRYFCLVCGQSKVYRKRMNVLCKSCGIPTLEDAFFDGIEAIIPDEIKATVNRSVAGVGVFSKKDSLVC